MEPYSSTGEFASLGSRRLIEATMALSRALVGLTARSLNELGADVTLTQYRTLIVLASRGPQRTAELASELGVTPSTVTRNCDRMVRRGLVRRKPGEADRRVVWVGLTEAGKDLVGRAMAIRRESLASLASGVKAADIPAFARAANRMAVAAGELPDPQWWRQWERSTSVNADTAC